jgi:hypothetical protein
MQSKVVVYGFNRPQQYLYSELVKYQYFDSQIGAYNRFSNVTFTLADVSGQGDNIIKH